MAPSRMTDGGRDTLSLSPRPRRSTREEDRPQEIVASEELGRRTVETDLSPFDEEGVLGQAHGPVDALLDEDDGGPVGVDPANDGHETLDGDGGQSQGELVDHEQARRRHHDPGQGQHLLLAARQGARRLVEAGLELGEQVDGFVDGGRRPGALTTEGVLPDPQVLPHGQTGEGHLPPHQQGHALVDDLLGLEVRAVGAEDTDDPPVGMVEPRHGPQQRALAGAVGPEQGHDLAFGHLEVDIEEHLLGPVEEVEVVDLQGGDLAARLPSFPFGVAFEDVLDDHGDVAAHDNGTRRPEGVRRSGTPGR
jgi:hypothetical protein